MRAYYIQDFEPNFFPEGSPEFRIAWDSYDRYPDLVRFTKTEWNRRVLREKIGLEAAVVGPSVNIDRYRPNRRYDPEYPERPLRIAAMIRPSTGYRAPKFTVEVLREFCLIRQERIEPVFFGCDPHDLRTLGVQDDFPYRNSGILTRPQVAALLSEVDIFADFSTHQAMGLTAMEAMCCGNAVLVPKRGGASGFVRHEENGLIVDTASSEACLAALGRLTEDSRLRIRLQRQAISDICEFFPARAALNILNTVFGQGRHTEISFANSES